MHNKSLKSQGVKEEKREKVNLRKDERKNVEKGDRGG